MSDKTLRRIKALSLLPVKHYTAAEIKQIRLRNKISQAVFAACLNTSLSAVQKWEQGAKNPSGLSLKLLNIVDQKGLAVLTLGGEERDPEAPP